MMDNYVDGQSSYELMENKYTRSTVWIHLVQIPDFSDCPILVPEPEPLDLFLPKSIY